MILGAHISNTGKVYETLDEARGLGCDTMQFFSRSPQNWRKHKFSPEDIAEFRFRRQKTRINPVFIHIPYLINLASPDPKLYHVSIKAYIEDIKEAEALGVDYIVTHMGSHKKTSEIAGIKRLARALNKIIEATDDCKAGILLENTSGSGSWLGYKFSHQKKVLQDVKNKERLGFCFDTAHAYLAGHNISTEEGLEKMLGEIEKAGGIDLVKLIHFNDAKDELGSRHDRHEYVGEGRIGMEGMKRILNHHKLKNIPFVLETPKAVSGSVKKHLQMIREMREDK